MFPASSQLSGTLPVSDILVSNRTARVSLLASLTLEHPFLFLTLSYTSQKVYTTEMFHLDY